MSSQYICFIATHAINCPKFIPRKYSHYLQLLRMTIGKQRTCPMEHDLPWPLGKLHIKLDGNLYQNGNKVQCININCLYS